MKQILESISAFYPFLMIALTFVILIYIFINRAFIYNKGYRLIKERQYEIAINEFLKETEKNKMKASLFNGLGYCYLMLGDNLNSIKNYEIALELNASLIEAYLALAILYAEENKFNIAFDFIYRGKAFQKKSSFFTKLLKSHIIDIEAWVYYLQGEKKRALELYLKILPKLNRYHKHLYFKYSERFSPSYYRLGIIYKLKGEIEKAKEKFEQSIKASPPSIFAKRSQKELKELEKVEM